ncbi:MAG TPA: hypothetical protein VEK79_07275 [Thermoanaerobaculia bacterium]|nr:hypothetical protein [Thermoanaerobaculia bacterium]
MTSRHLSLLAVLLCGAPSVRGQEALDVTFFVTGDTHIGDTTRFMTDQIAANHVRALNELATPEGRLKWPDAAIGAGTPIPMPEAVFVAGDLMVDNAINEHPMAKKLLRQFYVDRPHALQAHAYLAAGNHDVVTHNDAFTPLGLANMIGVNQIVEETSRLQRVALFQSTWSAAVAVPNHYAVTMGANGRLLVVVLSPSIAEPCRAISADGRLTNHGLTRGPAESDCDAVAWLKNTLQEHVTRTGTANAPIVIIQHYGYDPPGIGRNADAWSSYWWNPEVRALFEEAIRGYNVLALINGHAHVVARLDPAPVKVTAKAQPVFGEDVSVSVEVGFEGTRGWADVDRNGTLDFCRILSSRGAYPSCRLFDGTKFTTREVSGDRLDAGWDIEDGRAWVDVNDDGYADFCRVVGSPARVDCTLSTGTGFGNTISSPDIGGGGARGAHIRFWVDANKDRKTDFCHVSGTTVTCHLSSGKGFDKTIAGSVGDAGWKAGRAFADVDGDGNLDYCRTMTEGDRKFPRCALYRNSFNDSTFVSTRPLDIGADAGRTFVDVNGDRFADFCRLTDYREPGSNLGAARCTLSNGHGFVDEIHTPVAFYEWPPKPASRGIDLGFDAGRAWADFDNDGNREFCRPIIRDSEFGGRVACAAMSGYDVFGPRLDPGFASSRSWVDVNNDNRADYCRITGRDSGTGTVGCVLAKAIDAKTPPVVAFTVASGHCGSGNDGGLTVFRVTENRFEAADVDKIGPCADKNYMGTVQMRDFLYSKPIVTR